MQWLEHNSEYHKIKNDYVTPSAWIFEDVLCVHGLSGILENYRSWI